MWHFFCPGPWLCQCEKGGMKMEEGNFLIWFYEESVWMKPLSSILIVVSKNGTDFVSMSYVAVNLI